MKNITKTLLLLCLVFLSGRSSFCMQQDAKQIASESDSNDSIDFKFGDKPKNTKVYDWCLEVAKKNAKEVEKSVIKRFLLKNIGKNIEWDKVDSSYRDEYKKNSKCCVRNIVMRPIPSRIFDIVLRISGDPVLKRQFEVQKIEQYPDTYRINIYTKKCGIVHIMVTDFVVGSAFVAGNNVVIGLNFANSVSDQDLENTISHELGHIYYQHGFKSFYVRKMFNEYKKGKKNAFDACDFEKDMRKISRAQELQADLFSILGDLIRAKRIEVCFRKQISKRLGIYYSPTFQFSVYNSYFTDPFSTHPVDEQRVNYMRQVCLAMEKEEGIMSLPHKVFLLGKLELEAGQFEKALSYFSLIKNNDKVKKDAVKANINYVRGKMKLKIFELKDACVFFEKCAAQDADLEVRGKSLFELGRLYLSAYKNVKTAEKYLTMALSDLDHCTEIRERAGMYLMSIELEKEQQESIPVRPNNMVMLQPISNKFFKKK